MFYVCLTFKIKIKPLLLFFFQNINMFQFPNIVLVFDLQANFPTGVLRAETS